MEDETRTDLLPIVNSILRRWRIVVTVMVLVAVVAGVFGWIFPPSYQAVAGVAIIKARTDVTFDARFKTLDNETLAGTASVLAADARRNALVGLVKNGAIAQTVIARLGEQLKPAEQDAAELMSKVDAQLVNKGDLIQIMVTNGDPDRAAAIANAWAVEYERYINSMYRGQSLEYSKAISPEIQLARQDYDRAQADLEAFTKMDRTEELTRTITEKQNIIDTLQTGKQTAVIKQVDVRIQRLANTYASRLKLERVLADARSLEAQIRQAGAAGSATSSLAILLLKAEAYASSAGLSSNLQLQLPSSGGQDVDAQGQGTDLQALVNTLGTYIAELDTSIAQQSQQLFENQGYTLLDAQRPVDDPISAAMKQRYSEVRGMQSELERERSIKQKLDLTRDLAWQSYSALASKETELGISSAMGGSEVRFAAPAVRGSPVGSRVLIVAIAVVAGLLLGLASALAVDSLMSLYGAATGGGPGARRNRVFGWLLAESAGLPIAARRQKTDSRSGSE